MAYSAVQERRPADYPTTILHYDPAHGQYSVLGYCFVVSYVRKKIEQYVLRNARLRYVTFSELRLRKIPRDVA